MRPGTHTSAEVKLKFFSKYVVKYDQNVANTDTSILYVCISHISCRTIAYPIVETLLHKKNLGPCYCKNDLRCNNYFGSHWCKNNIRCKGDFRSRVQE
jgi:hypothetical protein